MPFIESEHKKLHIFELRKETVNKTDHRSYIRNLSSCEKKA